MVSIQEKTLHGNTFYFITALYIQAKSHGDFCKIQCFLFFCNKEQRLLNMVKWLQIIHKHNIEYYEVKKRENMRLLSLAASRSVTYKRMLNFSYLTGAK